MECAGLEKNLQFVNENRNRILAEIERLEREQEIDTPIDVLSWKYHQYVKNHPICRWDVPTCILFAGMDNLQSRQGMEAFAKRFGCRLTIAEHSQHPFMEEGDIPVVENWLKEHILGD